MEAASPELTGPQRNVNFTTAGNVTFTHGNWHPVYPPPPLPKLPLLKRAVITVAFWPADLASWFGHLIRWHLGAYRLYCWIVTPAWWVWERVVPETYRRTGKACPCSFTEGTKDDPRYFEDADPDCGMCFGSGHIWLDHEGNVIGNTLEEAS